MAAVTWSVDSTSTPRWSRRVAGRFTFDEDELERRLGDGEVRVPRPAFGELGAEQLGVEGDRAFEVGDA